MPDNTVSVAQIESLRAATIAFINKGFDDLLVPTGASASPLSYRLPTPEEGRDPRNKNGHNLTERGVELLYRMFDDGAGYNRAAKMLNITQAAAKHRKGAWEKAGGLRRRRLTLDFDVVV